jgi:hypothetical protein
MEPTKELRSFPLLPKEVRHTIWHHAASNYIQITLFSYKPSDDSFSPHTVFQHPSIPLLSVNREARNATLRLYTKVEAGVKNGCSTKFNTPVYIQSAMDIMGTSGEMSVAMLRRLVDGLEKNGVCATSMEALLECRLAEV